MNQINKNQEFCSMFCVFTLTQVGYTFRIIVIAQRSEKLQETKSITSHFQKDGQSKKLFLGGWGKDKYKFKAFYVQPWSINSCKEKL